MLLHLMSNNARQQQQALACPIMLCCLHACLLLFCAVLHASVIAHVNVNVRASRICSDRAAAAQGGCLQAWAAPAPQCRQMLQHARQCCGFDCQQQVRTLLGRLPLQ